MQRWKLITCWIVGAIGAAIACYLVIFPPYDSVYVDLHSGRIRRTMGMGPIEFRSAEEDTRFSRYFPVIGEEEWVRISTKYRGRGPLVNTGLGGLDHAMDELVGAIGSRQLEGPLRESIARAIAAAARERRDFTVFVDEQGGIELMDTNAEIIATVPVQ